jgi:hypothetical protein
MAKIKEQMALFNVGTSRETTVLINRIKDGHTKIWEQWQLIQQMAEGSGKDKYLATWDDAVKRLRGLAGELVRMGYKECISRGAKLDFPCLCCTVPNDLWRKEDCLAWELENAGDTEKGAPRAATH